MKNEISLFGETAPKAAEPNGRDLYITSEITEGMIETIVLPILKINKEDSNLKVREPINIYIHSPGGNIWVAFAIIDVIKQSETPINTINLGYAASAAFLILAAGHKRFSYSNSSFMIHAASWDIQGKIPAMISNMKEVENVKKKTADFLKEKTFINEHDIEKMGSNEWWMTSQEAKDYMVIDEIIGQE